MRTESVEITYAGAVLSVNHYKYAGGIYTTKEARAWKYAIGWQIKGFHIEEWKLPVRVRCDGRFIDRRHQPDLHNLSKTILDAIEDTTGINDRNLRWEDGEPTYGQPPILTLTFTEADDV